MKKYILAAALVMASTSAMAERMVTAVGLESPGSHDKISACNDAKQKANRQTDNDEHVKSYGKCECEINKNDQWTCSVDATVTKK